ncbi:DMT family transporter [Nocardia crassostreae]|uniref:DMT family transporter n=1 Tax=Nocardia crassostreae TaxID=53428 RepID=UPI000A8AE8EB|nr:DMT family transporter [Nocardia crassostreae]
MDNRLFELTAPPALILMWSSAFIAGIIGVGAAPPMLVLFTRFAVAGALLLGYGLLARAVWPRGRLLGHTLVAGLLMQIVQFGGFYTAMSQHVSAAVIALVQGLSPVVIAVFAGVLGETVTPRQWLGFGIGGLGVGLAVVDQSTFTVTGLLLCVLGLAGLSLGTVYQKRFTPGIDPRAATALHVTVSAPFAGLLALLGNDFHISDPGRFASAMAWMVLINSMAAFLLFNHLLLRWDNTRVGRFLFATPAVTALLAWWLIDQRVGPLTIAGLSAGLVGMVLATRRAVRPAPLPEPATPLAVSHR